MSVARRARALVDVDHPGLVWLMSLNHGFNEFYSVIVPPLSMDELPHHRAKRLRSRY